MQPNNPNLHQLYIKTYNIDNMKNLLCLLPLSFFIVFLAGCSDNDDPNGCGCENAVSGISGKWRLEKALYIFSPNNREEDFSKYNITIEIKSEKTLIVHAYESREGVYFFEPNEYPITKENDYYTAVLNGSSYWIYIRDNQLFIDLSQLDGPRFFFCCIDN